jgi:LCP family protein required for cell wall assembly
MPAHRVVRVIATVAAVVVVLGTGVAWSKVRSFEDGIFHVFAPSLGHGGDDGAIDILLVGMDSRTDAHGNPLSAEELAALRAGDEVASNTDTIILVRIPNNGKSATAISIPRDTYVSAPGLGKTKINGVYGQTKEEKRVSLVESGVAAAEAEAEGTEAGREALIKTVADLTGVTVDHYAEIGLLGFALITDALGGVNVCLKEPVYEQLSGETLSSPATMNRLQQAIQRSVVLSSGWDIIDFVNQLQKLAAGKIAFATIPVLDESGWSDDGMHSVVRVDPHQVQDWVAGLLHDQAQGKTEELAYTPDKTTANVLNDTDINGLAASVSEVLTSKGFAAGKVGNNDAAHVSSSQVQAAKADDLGAQAVAKELGGLPVIANTSLPPGSVRVVLANDYTGPGAGLSDGPTAMAARSPNSGSADNTAPPPSPILTAGSEHPECVN